MSNQHKPFEAKLDKLEPTPVSNLKRGQWVKHILSGFEGHVSGVSWLMDGSIQVGIQAAMSPGDKEIPKLQWIDENVCQASDATKDILDSIIPADDLLDLRFGDLVKDTITGHTGRITELSLCVNGCVIAVVNPKSDFSESAPKAVWFNQHRLVLVNEKGKTVTREELEKANLEQPKTQRTTSGAPGMSGDRAIRG